MGVNRKRLCSESDTHPSFKRLCCPSHPPDSTTKPLPSSVSKHAFDTSEYSPPDAASSDACLKTIRTAYPWPRGQQQLNLAQISDTIKDSIEESQSVNPNIERITKGSRISKSFTFREEELLPSPQALWASRRRTKSVPLSGQDLRQIPKSSPKSLHLDKSTSREQSILPLSHASATLKRFTGGNSLSQATFCKANQTSKSLNSDNWVQRKQPHSTLVLVNESLTDLTEGVFNCEPGGIQETDSSQNTCLTRANLRKHTHSLLIRFAENQVNFLEGALEEWAFIMSKTAGTVKEPNITTGGEDYEPNINLRNVWRVDKLPAGEPTPAPPVNFSQLSVMLTEESAGFVPCSETKFSNFNFRLPHANSEALVTLAYPVMVEFDKYANEDSDYLQYLPKKKWTNLNELYPKMTPRITTPNPDHAIGIQKHKFPPKAYKYMKEYASPAFEMGPWILLVREDKQSDADKGIAQNMWSGAHIVNNILALKRTLGIEDRFYDFAHVISMVADKANYRVWAHWVHRKDGEDFFYSQQLFMWKMSSPAREEFDAASRACHNVLHHIEHVVGPEIERDMNDLEAKLNTPGWKSSWDRSTIPTVPRGEGESVTPENVTTTSSTGA